MDKINLSNVQAYIDADENKKEILIVEYDEFILINENEITGLEKYDRQELLLLIDMLKDIHKDIKNFHEEHILYDLSELTNFRLTFKKEDLELLYINPYRKYIKSIKPFYKLKKEIEDIRAKKQMLQKVS